MELKTELKWEFPQDSKQIMMPILRVYLTSGRKQVILSRKLIDFHGLPLKDEYPVEFDLGLFPLCTFPPDKTTTSYNFICKNNSVSPTLYSASLVRKFVQAFGIHNHWMYADFRLNPIEFGNSNPRFSIEFVFVKQFPWLP